MHRVASLKCPCGQYVIRSDRRPCDSRPVPVGPSMPPEVDHRLADRERGGALRDLPGCAGGSVSGCPGGSGRPRPRPSGPGIAADLQCLCFPGIEYRGVGDASHRGVLELCGGCHCLHIVDIHSHSRKDACLVRTRKEVSHEPREPLRADLRRDRAATRPQHCRLRAPDLLQRARRGPLRRRVAPGRGWLRAPAIPAPLTPPPPRPPIGSSRAARS